MGNDIAVPSPMLGTWKKHRQNAVFSGETRVPGNAEPISPRVAASLREPMLGQINETQNGREEGNPSGRSIGQMVRWHHPGEDPDLLPRVTNIG